MRFCPHILEAPHPRAGEPCGRRYLTGEACEKHRPAKEQVRRPATAETVRRSRQRKRLLRASCGLPEGWE